MKIDAIVVPLMKHIYYGIIIVCKNIKIQCCFGKEKYVQSIVAVLTT